MASFIENVNTIYSKLGLIEAAPQYAQEAGVYAQQSLSASNSALASSVIAQSSAAQCSQNLSDTIRTKDELLAMKESFGLAVRTESAIVMLDSFGRYFVQASLVPYGDVLVATVDDGDNDIDIIDGVVSDRELKRFYFTDVSLLGKTIIFKYLGSAINTPLSQYLKDTIDALDLLDYKTSIDSYATSKIDDVTMAINTIGAQKQSDVLVYADGIYATTSLKLDAIKAEITTMSNLAKEDAALLYTSTNAQLETIRLELLNFAESSKQEALEVVTNALLDGISVEEFVVALGTFNEFDAALS